MQKEVTRIITMNIYGLKKQKKKCSQRLKYLLEKRKGSFSEVQNLKSKIRSLRNKMIEIRSKRKKK
jgi:hypothetical protein